MGAQCVHPSGHGAADDLPRQARCLAGAARVYLPPSRAAVPLSGPAPADALLNRDPGAAGVGLGVALLVYTAFYAAYDALGGLAAGIIYDHAQQTGNPAIATFAHTHLGDPATDLVQWIGTLAWSVALGLTIVHWWRAGHRSPLLGLLAVSALALWWNHPGLPGVITYGSLALAMLLLPRFGRSSPLAAGKPRG